jgi:Toxin SymE, type I toxin-antitoxin system
MKTTRTLRVGAMYRPATHRAVPHLRLTGDWLRVAGFPAGAPVDVAIADGTLTIRSRAALRKG